MELDPIVLLAYVSVAVNIVTIIAAAIAYAIFRIRGARKKPSRMMGAHETAAPFEPIFLKPYQPPAGLPGSASEARQGTPVHGRE